MCSRADSVEHARYGDVDCSFRRMRQIEDERDNPFEEEAAAAAAAAAAQRPCVRLAAPSPLHRTNAVLPRGARILSAERDKRVGFAAGREANIEMSAGNREGSAAAKTSNMAKKKKCARSLHRSSTSLAHVRADVVGTE